VQIISINYQIYSLPEIKTQFHIQTLNFYGGYRGENVVMRIFRFRYHEVRLYYQRSPIKSLKRDIKHEIFQHGIHNSWAQRSYEIVLPLSHSHLEVYDLPETYICTGGDEGNTPLTNTLINFLTLFSCNRDMPCDEYINNSTNGYAENVAVLNLLFPPFMNELGEKIGPIDGGYLSYFVNVVDAIRKPATDMASSLICFLIIVSGQESRHYLPPELMRLIVQHLY
jgi:hypothetical protein